MAGYEKKKINAMDTRGLDQNATVEAANTLIRISQAILDPKTIRKLRKLSATIKRNASTEQGTATSHVGEEELAVCGLRHLPRQKLDEGEKDGEYLSRQIVPAAELITANRILQSNCQKAEVIPRTRKIEELNSMSGQPQWFFTKALFDSDVNPIQCRLLIPRKSVENHLHTLLCGNEKLEGGIDVVVYDEDGKEYFMVLKFWGKAPVLIKTWKEFLEEHRLQVHDTITAWIFSREGRSNQRLPILMMIQRKL